MTASKHKLKVTISIGLMVTFLFTAIALPLVSLPSVSNNAVGFELKSTEDASNQNAQLPIAEKESEEDERQNEKAQNFAPLFIGGLVEEFVFTNRLVSVNTHYSNGLLSVAVPLYLFKRTLLI